MNEPKKHHYVPECYLKLFTNSKKEFWKLNKTFKTIKVCTPGMVCYERDLFKIKKDETLVFNNILDRNYVEKDVFKQQENNYGKVIHKIIKFSQNSFVVEKNNFLLFLKMLITIKRRNPTVRKGFMEKEFLEEFSSKLGEKKLRDYLQRLSDALGDKINVDEYMNNYYNNIDDEKLHDISLSAFFPDNKEKDLSSQVAIDLYQLKQFIIHCPIGLHFITSDNPGFTEIRGAILNFGGFGQPFKFYFPLSPSTCLLVDSTKPEEKNIIEKAVYPLLGEKLIVDFVNRNTINNSIINVLSHSKEVLSEFI